MCLDSGVVDNILTGLPRSAVRSPSTHLKPGPLRVAVRDLPVTRHAVIDPALIAEVVAGMPLREALGEDRGGATDSGELDVELYADDTTVFVQGTIKGSIAIACSRCVAPMALAFEEPLRVTYVPAAEMPVKAADGDDDKPAAVDDDGVELTPDALDVFPYDGETVDLEALVREQFVLAVPYAPLCREDCKGLCAQCGADKNLAPCECARPVDPRFAGLAGIKLPS
jgi:uncharacterized protein